MKLNSIRIIIIITFLSQTLISNAQGVFTSKATGSWSTGTTTAFNLTSGSDADGIPDADDDVIIASGHTITVDGAYSCKTLVINAASAATRVTIGANSLTVGNGTGAVTINTPIAAFTSQITLTTGSLTCGDITIGGGAASYVGQINITGAATVTCTGVTFTGTAAQARFVMAASSQLKIATGTLGTGGTFTCSTGTVEFTTLTGGQTVNAYNYYNLKHSNTSGINTAAGAIAMTGTLTTTAGGTFDLSTYALSGVTTAANSGTLRTSNTSATPITTTLTWGGTVEYTSANGGQTVMRGTYNNLTLLNSSGSNTLSSTLITVNGTFTTTNGGTFAPGAAVTLNGNVVGTGLVAATAGVFSYSATTGGQNILQGTYYSLSSNNSSGTNSVNGNITLLSGGTLTVASGGTLDLGTNTLSVGATFTSAGTGTIKTSNTSGTPLTTGKTWVSTVEYAASADQTVMAGTYTGLTTSGSGTKTVSGNIVLPATATLTIGSSTTLDLTANYTLSGAATSLTVSGSGNLKTSVLTATSATPIITTKTWTGITVIYASTTGSQTVMRGTYTNLTLLNSSGTNTISSTLVTVNGTFTTTAGGTFQTAALALTLNGPVTCGATIASSGASTVTYGLSTGGQNILTGTYYNLTFSNTSGTNKACGNIALNASGRITTTAGGTFDLSTFTLTGGLAAITTGTGTIKTSNTSGTPVPSGKTWTGTVEYASASSQTLMQGTYNSITISGGGEKTLSGNVTIGASGVLTLTSGLVTPSASTLTIDNLAVGAISGGSSTSYVNGAIKWKINTTVGSFIFPVGSGVNYYPFTLTNPTRSGASQYVTVSATASNPSGSNGSCVSSMSSAEYWTVVLTTANLSGATISLGRTAALGSLTGIGQASTSNGAYASLAGTVSGTNINTSNAITTIASAGTNYFTMVQVSSTTPTITTPTSASVSTTTVTLGGNITAVGCANITERGIYYSTTNGFADGAGTKVSVTAGPYTAAVFTIPVTGLIPSTVYYYKAFATSSNGTVYTTQGTFTTTAQSFPVTEGFESDAAGALGAGASTTLGSKVETSSWSINNAGGGCGTNSLRIATAISNQWYFTPTFYATAGKIYTVSYNGNNTQSTASVNIYIATAQASASAITTTDYFTGSGSANFAAGTTNESSNGWLCTTSGTYTFGFKVSSGGSALRLDCISISETNPATITWDGSSSTDWATAANWDLGRVPTSSDIIIIPSSGVTNYPASVPAGSYNSISLNNGGAGGTTTINASTIAGDLTITSSSTGNTVTLAGTTTVGGNISICGSGSAFTFNCNASLTGQGTLILGNAASALTTNISYPISVAGALTLGTNTSNVTNISYSSLTGAVAAIRSSNSGSYVFYGAVNYTATSGDQIVMKSQYNGAVTASGGGNRFMEGDLDINNSLTISGGKWYCGNPNEKGNSGNFGSDANTREAVSPYKGAATDGKFQMIFKSSFMSGITSNDLLTSLSFYVLTKGSSNPFKNFTIKLGLTTAEEFVGSSMAGYTYLTPTTTVFTAKDVTTVADSWNTHTFDTPFAWDGSSNLLVEITFDNDGFAGPGGTDLIAYYDGAFADDIIAYNSSFACGSIYCPTYNGVTMTSNSNYLGRTIFNIADGPYDINITNNWLNSGGEFYHLTNTVTFDGTANQTVTTNGDNFYNFVVNNTSGTTALTLADDSNIEGTGTLTDGIITTGANKLISLSTTAANLTGYSNASFVNGNLRRYIATNTSTYGLPLGNGTGTTNYYLADIINGSLTGTDYLDAKFVTGTAADYNQADFEALSKEMTGTGVTTKAMKDLDPKGYFQIDPDLQPSGGDYSIRMNNTNYTLANWVDNDQCIFKRPTGSSDMADFNMAGTISADNGSGRLVADGFLLSTGLSSFSEFIPALATASPLPVELIDYTVNHYQKNKAIVSWKTLSERNCDFYTVEKTLDGKNFEFLGNIKGKGNSITQKSYYEIDEKPYRGTSYYRLSQVDFNGKRTYYPLKSITFSDDEILIYPNPTNNSSFTIEYEALSDDVLNVVLYNTIGEMIYTEKIDQKKGDFSEQVKTSLLSKGIYYVELSNNQFGVIVEKIVVN